MKVVSFFALTLASVAAFQQMRPAFRPATMALQITPEEDLELTREVINKFFDGDDAPAPAPEPEKKEAVAAAEE